MATKKTPDVTTGFVFDKDMFKRSVLYNIKTLHRKTIDDDMKRELVEMLE